MHRGTDMESKIRDIIEVLKSKGLLNNILVDLNLSSYNELILLIDRQIYAYIENLRIFLTRLFEICYEKPLREFNKLPLEVLFYFVYQKEHELQNCYSVLKKNSTYLRLKKIPSESEYKKILKILSILGINIGRIYNFKNKYNFAKLNNTKQVKIKEIPKTSKNNSNKIRSLFFFVGFSTLFLSVSMLSYLVFSLNQEVKNFKSLAQTQNKDIEKLKEEYNNLKKNLNFFQQNCQNLSKKYKIFLYKMQMQSLKIKKLNEEIKNLTQAQSKNVKDLREKYNKLKENLSFFQRKYQRLSKQLNELESKCSNLQKERKHKSANFKTQ